MAVGAVILSLAAAVSMAFYLSSTVGMTLLGVALLYTAMGTLALTTIFWIGWLSVRRAD